MTQQRIGGTVFLKRNGTLLRVKPGATFNLGLPMRETVLGADGIHGYTEKQTVPYIEATISDGPDVNIASLQATEDDTITLELINGKTIILRNAWMASDLVVNTETGEIPCRWEGLSANEVI